MIRVYHALGVAQAGSAAALFIAWLKSESVQTYILLAAAGAVVTLVRWALGRLIKVAENKIDTWEENFVTMGETLRDVPRMADHKELDRKVDELKSGVDAAATRLADHSGRISAIEAREASVVDRALTLVEQALKKDIG